MPLEGHVMRKRKEYACTQLADVEFLLFGRMTYELFSARWPQIKGDKYFDRINGLKKLVASTTLTDVTWNASVINGDATETLKALKQQDGGTIVKYGISQLDRTLLADQLV